MSNLNTILNKLGKIEEIHETNLAKHEVYLGIKEDVAKLNQESIKTIKLIGSYVQDIDKSYDVLINNKKSYQSDKKQFDNIKKEYDFIYGKYNQSINDLKNNISNSENKIKNIKTGQSNINNILSKTKSLKNTIDQASKELGIEPKNSKQYIELIDIIDNLDMLLEDSTQSLISYEKELNYIKSLIK